MKWVKRLTAVACLLIMVAFVGYTSVKAEPVEQYNNLEEYKLQGLGRLQSDIDGSGEYGDNPEDFIYDADDLVTLDNLVKNGKTELSSVINSYQTGDVLTLDSFANLSSAIDSLSTFPSGKYYYDSTTGTEDATTLIRYIKEGESYYLCDQYGNKTSDEEQAVIESNLVEYQGLTQENLTAGYAGMVDKTFVLGNGSDNVTYKNIGIEYADRRINTSSASYNKGYTDGLASAQNANIQYTYHYHNDSCYTLYANGNCNACGKAGGSYPADKTPTQCGACKRSWTWVTNSTTNVLTCGYNEGQILSATITF